MLPPPKIALFAAVLYVSSSSRKSLANTVGFFFWGGATAFTVNRSKGLEFREGFKLRGFGYFMTYGSDKLKVYRVTGLGLIRVQHNCLHSWNGVQL